jgi:hypothetical protein
MHLCGLPQSSLIFNGMVCEMNIQPLVEQYLIMTREVMPKMSREATNKWPVKNDHCFQRIVLDSVCRGVWYESIERPAYKHLNYAQAKLAVKLCDEIIAGEVDLSELNIQSLIWRGKR